MKEWLKKHQVTEVECIVPDLSGAARGKIMPASLSMLSPHGNANIYY